jgi:hypothetical protein
MKLSNDVGRAGLTAMDSREQFITNGGESVMDLNSTISPFVYYLWKFCKSAAEYQSSLPANLKK